VPAGLRPPGRGARPSHRATGFRTFATPTRSSSRQRTRHRMGSTPPSRDQGGTAALELNPAPGVRVGERPVKKLLGFGTRMRSRWRHEAAGGSFCRRQDSGTGRCGSSDSILLAAGRRRGSPPGTFPPGSAPGGCTGGGTVSDASIGWRAERRGEPAAGLPSRSAGGAMAATAAA